MTIEDAAAGLKLPASRVAAWEAGEEPPSVAQLRKLAEMYRRAVAVFFLPEPPKGFDTIRDFRRTTDEGPALSEELEADLRRAQELRDAALSLFELGEAEPDGFDVTARLADDPDAVASRIREKLAVSHDEQLKWDDSYEALREWRSAVENLNVLVVNMARVNVSEARGFSIAHFPLPLIALNAKDSPNGRLFTLMHELAHLALHEGGICDWTPERKLVTADRRIETFCNQVAASILLPEDLVRRLVAAEWLPAADNWPEDILRRHAKAASVSEEAFLRRLTDLGLSTPEFYARKRAEYLERYAAAAKKVSKPIVSFEKRVVGKLGRAYLDLAFSAYYEHRLTLSELSSYTGVRVQHLAKVEREAFGMSRVPGAA